MEVVEILFDKSPKKYDYYCDLDPALNVGDLAVVPAGSALAVGRVVGKKQDSDKAQCFIVQRVEREAIKEAKRKESLMEVW